MVVNSTKLVMEEKDCNKKITQDSDSIFVFQQGKELLGTISIIDDGRVGMLFRFIVKDHNKVVAKALYERATAVLKDRGHEQVLVYSPKDKELAKRYTDLGMHRGGTYTCYWSEL